MPFYPDWIVTLDDVAKGKPGAVITARDAENIIRELTQLKAQVKAFTTPEERRTNGERMTIAAAYLATAARV